MTRESAIALAFFTTLVILYAMLVYVTVHRWRRHRRQRRRDELVRRVRPVLVAAAAEEATGDEVEQLSDIPSDVIERAAMDLLGKLRGDAHTSLVTLLDHLGALESARQELYSPHPHERARAAHLIGVAGDRSAVADISRLLDDRVTTVALAAARSLGRLGDPAAVPPLIDALDGARAIPAGVVSTSLLRIGAPAIAPLEQGLVTGGPTARIATAEVLGRLGATSATDILMAAMKGDPEPEVRVTSARALGQIGNPRAATALADCLSSTDVPSLRATSAWALGEVGNPDVIPLLTAAVDDSDHDVARAAADGLAALGQLGLAILDQLTATPGRSAAYAREALARSRLREHRSVSSDEAIPP